jgi:hypothetical protein
VRRSLLRGTLTAIVTDLNFRKKQTGDPNFGLPVILFLRLSLAPRRSFHTAFRAVSRNFMDAERFSLIFVFFAT